jgi:hypothetical protein
MIDPGSRRSVQPARRSARHALGILAALCCACAGPPDAAPAGPPERAASPPQRLLIAPLNPRGGLPYELDRGLDILGEEIGHHLARRGHAATAIAPELFEAVWMASARTVGGLLPSDPSYRERYEATVAQTCARLRRRAGAFDGLVLPNVVLRTVRFRGDSVKFDGVARRLRFVNVPRGYIVSHRSGETTVLSLRIEIYSAQGVRVFANRGGLDVLMVVDLESETSELRADPMTDRAELREGIRVAFAPYVPGG